MGRAISSSVGRRRSMLAGLAICLLACDSTPTSSVDVGADSGLVDGSRDAGSSDTGPTDASEGDSGSPDDGGAVDSGLFDAGTDVGTDAGDAGPSDVGPTDVGPSDVGPSDVGPSDVGPSDGGAADTGVDPIVDPSATGPFAVTTENFTVTRGNRDTPVTIHRPTRTGKDVSPVVIFVPGFRLSSERYLGLAEHVASHGFAFVRADPEDPLFGVSHLEMSFDVSAVVDELGNRGADLDLSRLAVSGHSLGGKVSVMTAFRDARIDAVVAIDPVNGGDPFTGYSMDLPDIVPDEVTPLAIPVGFLGETTNGQGAMPCASTDQNFQTFYDASTSAPWAAEWDFAGADHMDFVDDTSACFVCSACPAGTAQPSDVLAGTRTIVAAFLYRHLEGRTAFDAYLTGAQSPAGVTVRARP